MDESSRRKLSPFEDPFYRSEPRPGVDVRESEFAREYLSSFKRPDDPFDYAGIGPDFLTLEERRRALGFETIRINRGTLAALKHEIVRSIQLRRHERGVELDTSRFRGESIAAGIGLTADIVRRYIDEAWSRASREIISRERPERLPWDLIIDKVADMAVSNIERALDGGDPRLMSETAKYLESQRRFIPGPIATSALSDLSEDRYWEEETELAKAEAKPAEPKTAFLEGLEEIK